MHVFKIRITSLAAQTKVIVHSDQFRIPLRPKAVPLWTVNGAYAFQHRSAAPMEIGWLVTRTAKSCSTLLPAPQSPHQAGIRVLLQWEVSQISMRKTSIDVCSRQSHIGRLAQRLRPSDTSVPVLPA